MRVCKSGPGGKSSCPPRARRQANRNRRRTQRGKSASRDRTAGSRTNTGSTKKVLNAGNIVNFSEPKKTGKERREERREKRKKNERASQQRYSNPRFL